MITLIFFKVAITSWIVFLIVWMIEGFCNYENPKKNIRKHKVPTLVPIIGGLALIMIVLCFIIAMLLAVWL